MNNEAAVTTRQVFREKRRQNSGTRACENGILRRQAIEVGEQRFFHVELLGCVFLNVIRVGERNGKSFLDSKAAQQSLWAGAAKQIIRGQVRHYGCDEFDSAIGRAGILIPKRNVMSSARKSYRPSPADESSAIDGHMRHGFSSKRLDVAVYANRLPGNIDSCIGEQKRNHGGDVMGTGHAPE
jgi:hypothetical protein